MITRENYLNALELIDQYHKQLDLSSDDRNSSLDRKTPINEWKYINRCSRRLRNILYRKPIYLNWGGDQELTEGWKYIEDIDRHTFFMQRNAGAKSWAEFINLRGY